jgi:3-oxoacyl-[acyl-carrier-protein] synthase III
MGRKEVLKPPQEVIPFYDRLGVIKESIPVGEGIPLGIERLSNREIGIAGAYGAWGNFYPNEGLPGFIRQLSGLTLEDGEILDLSSLGFDGRHHTNQLSAEEHLQLEVQVGARFLEEAVIANDWEMNEVEAVLIGMSGPISDDYLPLIARQANIPDKALLVSVHKACDSSAGALHLALNKELEINQKLKTNIAELLEGKKVLVGGIEGLSRFMQGIAGYEVEGTKDKYAMQLFANGAGVIGVIPGETMKFLVGKDYEVFDEDGLLKVKILYPHSRKMEEGMVEVYQDERNHIRLSGFQHEPENQEPVDMSGPMGMVKLFVRNGAEVVKDVYRDYREKMRELGTPGDIIKTASVHHANLKINTLLGKKLNKEGITFQMPWVLNDFGNVSAASNMISFLRQLKDIKPGDHVMFDGFGAGTYYDVFVAEMGGIRHL